VTQLGSWAPTPQQYRSSFDMPGTHVVNGRHSGTAVITIAGNIVGGAFSVLYDNYSDDGKYFLSGRQSVDGSVTAAVTISDDLRATDAAGHRAGFLKADLTFRQIEPAPPAGEPGVAKSGTISSGWLGKTGSGLPNVGACPDSMPRPSPLTLIPTARVVRGTALIVARVTADVYGDQRPVQGATVTIGHTRARTDSTGTATIRLRIGSLPPARRRRRRRVRITASAGDTFIATATTIWLRSG
jgi:hypothetical protein